LSPPDVIEIVRVLHELMEPSRQIGAPSGVPED